MNHSKLILVFALLLGVAFCQNCCDDNTFQISGSAEVSVKPDRATISIQVKDQAKTSSQALNSVNQKIESVIGLLKQNGLTSSDYSTSSININPKYQYQFNQNVLVGQQASQTLSVVIKNIDSNGGKIGSIIDDVSTINGIIINGVTFDQSDSELGKSAARKAAFKNAQQKAQEYASLTGRNLLKVLQIQDTSSGNITPYFLYSASYQAASAAKTTVPVGNITVSANVQVSWAIV